MNGSLRVKVYDLYEQKTTPVSWLTSDDLPWFKDIYSIMNILLHNHLPRDYWYCKISTATSSLWLEALCKKCPNAEFFLVRIFPHSGIAHLDTFYAVKVFSGKLIPGQYLCKMPMEFIIIDNSKTGCANLCVPKN